MWASSTRSAARMPFATTPTRFSLIILHSLRPSQDGCDEGCGAEAVVDVDDGDAVGAGVEHAQQRRHAAKRGAVTHAGWHRHDRHADQSADHRWQSAFHARDHDERVARAQGFQVRQQAVQSGDADIVDLGDIGAHRLQTQCGFLGDRQIAGARANHARPPAPVAVCGRR